MTLRSLALCLSLFLQVGLLAQQATLKSSTTTPTIGEPFELALEVNARGVSVPGILEIPGIDILSHSPNRSSSFSIINGQVSARTNLSYVVSASEEGELTIAPIEIQVGQQKLSTNALKLIVKKGSGKPQPRLGPGGPTMPPGLGGQPPATNNGRQAFPSKLDKTAAFLKVVPTREEIYVGETVGVDIKAYFDAGIPLVNFTRELNLEGEDFITKPTVGPNAQRKRVRGGVRYQFKQERIDGRVYNVLTYRTTITAVKPGKFTLSPLTYNAVIQVPQPKKRQRRPQRRGFGGLFGGDPFDDPFFDDIFSKRQRELHLQSEALEVTVLSLPTEGRPEHFSGAIGRFSLDVLTDKKALKVDEALKVAATITGHGNFERITHLDSGSDESKWKSYPPKVSFNSTDELELSGEKTFEHTYIAVDSNDQAPIVRFAYFDPESKEYISLGGKPMPISVTGVATSSLTNQDLAALADQATAPGATTLAIIGDAGGLTFERGSGANSWFGSATLLSLNGSAAALALGLAIWQWRRQGARTFDPKQRQHQLKQERQTLFGELIREHDAEVIDVKLLRWLALQGHCREVTSRNLLPDEEAARLTVSQLPAAGDEKAPLEDFLNWSAQRRWSGAFLGLDASRRDAWMSAVNTLREQSPS